MQIDSRYVDVEFPAEQEYVYGCEMPAPSLAEELCASLPVYEDSLPLIPSSQWRELAEHIEAEKSGLEWFISRIFNQRQEGSCTMNSVGQVHETLQRRQFGAVVPVSPISAYQLIARSAQSGATIPDSLKVASEVGFVPLDTPENRQRFGEVVMPHTGFNSRRPEGDSAIAKSLRLLEWFVVRTLDGLVSAVLNGHPVCVGRQGHAIPYYRLIYPEGKIHALYPNSWNRWGFAAGDFDHGFGADSERLMRESSRWAFAARTTVVPAWEAI